jgi:hypothetical protein
MIWTAQKNRVDHLSLLARRASEDIAFHRHALHEWRSNTLGTLDALAWSFAAGAVWSAVPAGGRKTRAKRTVLGAANLLLLANRHR